jgi:hypothetical protein
MTGPAAIVADFHRAVVFLAEHGDTAVAEALARWLAGEEFEQAAGLAPGWRRAIQQTTRDTALQALVTSFPTLDDSALARRIVAGVARAARMHGVRPDGEKGLYFDLSRMEKSPTERTWRLAIAEIRGKGKSCACHSSVTPSATTGDLNGKKADTA